MMKPTGILRPVDPNGRVVIPKEIRRLMDLTDGTDRFEILMNDQNDLILRKYQPTCIFCGEAENVVAFSNRMVCRGCIDRLIALRETLPISEPS